jgi:Tol biopolymer transport system component
MLAAGLVLAIAAPAWAGQPTTRLVSQKRNGTDADGDSRVPSISGTGRYVAFESEADNLGGDPSFTNVFVKDMNTGRVRLVSRTRGGDPAQGDSFDPSISASGRYVAFESDADNLPGNDLFDNILVKDMETGRLFLASRTTGGDPADGSSNDPSLSGNGRYVAFESDADNLNGAADPDETNTFVHDLDTRRTRLVSRNSAGEPTEDGPCNDAVANASGRFIAFECENVLNLPGQTEANGEDQVYVRDMERRRTRLISKTTGGEPADGDSEDAAISANGRFVAFESEGSSNLPGSNGTDDQVYVHDRRGGRTRLVSKTTEGEAADGDSEDPGISGNGRFVAFESDGSTNLPEASAWNQVYRHDRERGRTILISRSNAGEAADDFTELPVGGGVTSAIGSFVAFESGADNLGGSSAFTHVYRRGPLG